MMQEPGTIPVPARVAASISFFPSPFAISLPGLFHPIISHHYHHDFRWHLGSSQPIDIDIKARHDGSRDEGVSPKGRFHVI